MIKRIAIVLMACVVSLAFYAHGFAGISLEKRELWYSASAGEKVIGSITLMNHDPQPVTVKAYVEDMEFIPPYDGARTFAPAGSRTESCAGWFNIVLREFIIPARQKQEVPFSIQVPADASGGYYSILFFETSNTPPEGEKAVGLVVRAGCSVYISTTDASLKADVQDIVFSADGLKGVLVNQGAAIVVAEGTFYLMDAAGIVVERGTLGKFYLPSGAQASFGSQFGSEIQAGSYTAVINFGSRQGLNVFKEMDVIKSSSGSITVGAIKE